MGGGVRVRVVCVCVCAFVGVLIYPCAYMFI